MGLFEIISVINQIVTGVTFRIDLLYNYFTSYFIIGL